MQTGSRRSKLDRQLKDQKQTRPPTERPHVAPLRAYISWLIREARKGGPGFFSIGDNNPFINDPRQLEQQLGKIAKAGVIEDTGGTLYPGGPKRWRLLITGLRTRAWLNSSNRTRPRNSELGDDERALSIWLNETLKNRRVMGRDLRTARQQRQLSTLVLAGLTGVSKSQILVAEKGQKNCSAQVIKRLADHLGVPLPVRGFVPLTPQDLEEMSRPLSGER